MFAVVVTFEIKTGEMERFLPAMRQNAHLSLAKEPDCLRFDVCADPARPHEVFLYELYRDKNAFDLHLQSTHFVDFDAFVGPMVAKKTVRTYTQVS